MNNKNLKVWLQSNFSFKFALNLTCVPVSDTHCFELDLCTCFRHRLLWTWPVYLFQTQIALNLTCVRVSDTDCFELDLCTCFRHIFDSPSTYQTLFKYLMDPSNMVHDVFRLSNVCLQQVHLSSVKRTFYCVNEHLNSCVITYFCLFSLYWILLNF